MEETRLWPAVGLLFGAALGFAVVDVNMRGTGCSGGAFNYFDPQQNLDGYDVIQTIANQPWVLDHKVGMMGISYGAISQLFTAQTDPPSLAAISPLSVIDATPTTLYPGGILNTGFAVAWAQERIHDALPASATGGQPWAYKRIQEGDAVCKGCGRTEDEVQHWPELAPAQKRAVWRRITMQGTAWRFNRYSERAAEGAAHRLVLGQTRARTSRNSRQAAPACRSLSPTKSAL